MRDDMLIKVQKPARYTGGEYGQTVKDKNDVSCRFAFCFPDKYEVGMSHLGIKILYKVLNDRPDTWCERVFQPDDDMRAVMIAENEPLVALESGDRINGFDFVGFTLQYEMCYPGVLDMLHLAGIPLLASERKQGDPIIVGGGPCSYNPEPIADFFDVFSIGEGEYSLSRMIDIYNACGKDREKTLQKLAEDGEFYVPSIPGKVQKPKILDIDPLPYPDTAIVPFTDIVHDRIMLEIMRGCIRGCRFCQAGMIYRPLREKSPETLVKYAKSLCEQSGYDEISLMSLSTGDYSCLEPLIDSLSEYTIENKINLSVPSLRIDSVNENVLRKIRQVRSSGLTFAPEAGSQRLRDVINKNLTEEEILTTCSAAFKEGYTSVKLYFMIGLPTETDEDILAINDLAEKVVELFYHTPGTKGKNVAVTISLSTLVPKPFTPFQWAPQITIDEIRRRQKLLLSSIRSRKIKLNYHDADISVVESALARGDRRVAKAVLNAWKMGARLEGWDDSFSFERWQKAFAEAGMDLAEEASRSFDTAEELPWDFIDIGISKKFLLKEYENAHSEKTTPDCRTKCSDCGVIKFYGGCPVCKK